MGVAILREDGQATEPRQAQRARAVVLTRKSRTIDIDSVAKSKRSPMLQDAVVTVVWMAAIPLGAMAPIRVRSASRPTVRRLMRR